MHCTSRPETPPARRAGLRLCWLVLACVWLFGCGGSGSSGFDLRLREDRAIDAALDSNGCEVNEGVIICAAGGAPSPAVTPTGSAQQTVTPTPSLAMGTATRTPSTAGTATLTPSAPTTATPTQTMPRATDTPTATPTFTMLPAAPQVDTNVTPGDSAECVMAAPGAACQFEFSFAPLGFPASVTYRVAVRALDASGSGDWSIQPPPFDNGASYGVVIPLDPAAQYQTAVLVFEQPPGALPEAVARLAETHADYAFVSPSFGVVALGF